MDLLTALLLALYAGREVLAYRERQTMLDRLMAKNLPEYKDNLTAEEPNEEDVQDETLPIEEAEGEVLDNGDED